MRDPYQVLGVSREASAEEIKAARRKLALEHHPDRVGGDPALMAEINVAYEILSDPEARERYNLTGEVRARDPLEQRARELIMGFCLHLMSVDEDVDGIELLKQFCHAQIEGIGQSRAQHLQKVEAFEARKRRLRGPPENFIGWWFEQQLSHLRQALERMDRDEETARKARELLEAFKWEGPPVLAGPFINFTIGGFPGL